MSAPTTVGPVPHRPPAGVGRAAAAVAVLALALATVVAPPAAADGSAVRGGELAQRWCASCHAVGAGDEASDAGPAFASLGDRSEDALRAWVSEPHGQMPDLQIGGPDIDDLVAWIRSVADE